MRTTIQHDHFPELALDGGAFKLAQQVGLGLTELISETERRSALVEMPTPVLIESIVKLNAVLRGNEASEGKIEDGKLPMLDTPVIEDKLPLLQETSSAFKHILSNTALDDKQALRRAGLTLAGGLNYIHPFKNGNGRTARLLQYFIEFGAERGDGLFEAEVFSAIGNIAVFEQDARVAVDTAPRVGMEPALNVYCYQTQPTEWENSDNRQKASMRVRAFLSAMKDEVIIPTVQDWTIRDTAKGVLGVRRKMVLNKDKGYWEWSEGTIVERDVPAGTSIVDFYQQSYEGESFTTRLPVESIPPDVTRVLVEKEPAPVHY